MYALYKMYRRPERNVEVGVRIPGLSFYKAASGDTNQTIKHELTLPIHSSFFGLVTEPSEILAEYTATFLSLPC